MESPISKLLALCGVLALSTQLSAQTVSLQPQAFLADASNTQVNDMVYGLVVDTDGNGFGDLDASGLSPFSIVTGVEMSPGIANSTGDVMYFSPTNHLTVHGGFTGGPATWEDGFASFVGSVPVTGSISEGDPWGLIWFADGNTSVLEGESYGFAVSGSLIPPAGHTVAYGLGYLGYADNVVVPEPSTIIVTCFGFLMLAKSARRPPARAMYRSRRGTASHSA